MLPTSAQLFLTGAAAGAIWWHASYLLAGPHRKPSAALTWLTRCVPQRVTYDPGTALWTLHRPDGSNVLTSSKSNLEAYLDQQDMETQ